MIDFCLLNLPDRQKAQTLAEFYGSRIPQPQTTYALISRFEGDTYKMMHGIPSFRIAMFILACAVEGILEEPAVRGWETSWIIREEKTSATSSHGNGGI